MLDTKTKNYFALWDGDVTDSYPDQPSGSHW